MAAAHYAGLSESIFYVNGQARPPLHHVNVGQDFINIELIENICSLGQPRKGGASDAAQGGSRPSQARITKGTNYHTNPAGAGNPMLASKMSGNMSIEAQNKQNAAASLYHLHNLALTSPHESSRQGTSGKGVHLHQGEDLQQYERLKIMSLSSHLPQQQQYDAELFAQKVYNRERDSSQLAANTRAGDARA